MEGLIGILLVFLICYIVFFVVNHISLPSPMNWVLTLVVGLILLIWIFNKYGIA